jgi:hypothetical protein
VNESDLGGATQENKPPLSEEEKAEAVKKYLSHINMS